MPRSVGEFAWGVISLMLLVPALLLIRPVTWLDEWRNPEHRTEYEAKQVEIQTQVRQLRREISALNSRYLGDENRHHYVRAKITEWEWTAREAGRPWTPDSKKDPALNCALYALQEPSLGLGPEVRLSLAVMAAEGRFDDVANTAATAGMSEGARRRMVSMAQAAAKRDGQR